MSRCGRGENLTMSVVAGIDGCRGGWLLLSLDLARGRFEARVLSRIDEIADLDPRPDLVTIDIPIGLARSGPRQCDREARRLLGWPRSSSVFPAPPRPVLEAAGYAEACSLGAACDGRRLSRQSWSILPKVREVDALLRPDPGRQEWIREVHPELSFWCWNSRTPMRWPKKSAAGFADRQKLVVARYGAAGRQAAASLPRGRFGEDDLMDAFAALWTAEHAHQGEAMVVPPDPPVDEVGLRMEIVV